MNKQKQKTKHKQLRKIKTNTRKKRRHTRRKYNYKKNHQKLKGGVLNYIQLSEPHYVSDASRTFNNVFYKVLSLGKNVSLPEEYDFYFKISQTPNYISQVNPSEPQDSCMFESYFLYKGQPFDSEKPLGHFSLSGLSYHQTKVNQQRCNIFTSGKEVSMGIGIDQNIRKAGLSRLLIRIVTQSILQMFPYVAENASFINLYIDVDASAGFWDYIKMQKEKGFERELEGSFRPLGSGYEKYINFQGLTNFGLGI
jgi:hypothetical protein